MGNTGFTLNFAFKENPFFTNQVLTKTYTVMNDIDLESPLTYDGPEVTQVTGCTIEWKEGMDVTITGDFKVDSFFDFFNPPAGDLTKTGDEEMEDNDRTILEVDIKVGFALKDRIIPRAVVYFTGEIYDDDFEDDEDEDD